MGEFIFAVLNTSLVVGTSIVVLHIFFLLFGSSYSAKCRKAIWILTAICLLLPFRLFVTPRAYTAEIPNVVLKEIDYVKTSHEQGGVGQTAPTDFSRQNPSKAVSRLEITLAEMAFILWICIGILMAGYYTAGYWRMKRKIKRWGNKCGNESIRKVLVEVSNQYGLKKIPGLYILHNSSAGPFTTGVLKNVVVLPDEVKSERDLGFIMKHEILHCKNKDIWWKLLFLVVNIIHWFNPLVWMLRRTAEQDMEIACDEELTFNKTKEYREEYCDVIMSWVTKNQYKGSTLATGYVQGVNFLKRRFSSIFDSRRKKKGILLIGATCIFIMFVGSMIQVKSGAKIYARRRIPILNGIEVRTDVDGDREVDKVFVSDNNPDGWDLVETSVSVRLSSGEEMWINYPERWDSYLVTGDLSGNGAADIVLVKIAWMSNHGVGDVTVLHVQTDKAEKPELVEYPRNFIQNPELEPEWIGGWENYPYAEDIGIFAEQPFTLDEDCFGAAIIEKDKKTMLRVIKLVDAQTDSGMCIDCSYTLEGWYIEDIQMVYDYYGGGWDEKLLGIW
ncbi:MAG: M56 family metallopeptidase [Butyrivibrio sp.]|nr:M56 family metallopeptidase [Butyrivibrio sp.]